MQLAIHTRGAGPRRIALVHGLGADGATWDPLIDEILAHVAATIIAPDLRGHGASPRAAVYDLASFADDLVETLPQGLDLLVGHSLGGAVAKAAVARLAPAHALYLDPGFTLGLPGSGLGARLFWAAAPLTVGVAALFTARGNRAAQADYPARSRALLDAAKTRFDRRMATAVFKDVTMHPVLPAPPEVPSTIILSAQSKAVVPEPLVGQLAACGWDIRRLADIRHDMQLQDPGATFAIARDLFVGASVVAEPRSGA